MVSCSSSVCGCSWVNPSILAEVTLSPCSSEWKELCPRPSSSSLQSWPETHLPFGHLLPREIGPSSVWKQQDLARSELFWTREKQHLGQVSCQGVQKVLGHFFLPPWRLQCSGHSDWTHCVPRAGIYQPRTNPGELLLHGTGLQTPRG